MDAIIETKDINGEQWVRWREFQLRMTEAYNDGFKDGICTAEHDISREERLFTASVAAMQGILANSNVTNLDPVQGQVISFANEKISTAAIRHATDLLKAIEKENGE